MTDPRGTISVMTEPVAVEYTDKWGTPGCVVITDADANQGDPREHADIFLQWKNIDACFDLHCRCGAHTHFDGGFAYAVECSACGQQYAMPMTVLLKPIDDADRIPS